MLVAGNNEFLVMFLKCGCYGNSMFSLYFRLTYVAMNSTVRCHWNLTVRFR